MPQGPQDPERETLRSYLTAQREHVLGILEGLGPEALRQPVLPSGWTCLGLVRHLAVDVERFWFRGVIAGEPTVIEQLARDSEDTWQVGSTMSAEVVLDSYRQEIDRADAIVAATPIDAEPAWWPEELFGTWRLGALRDVLLHVLAETACHAGHLDAARELLDGRQWMVLTD